MRKISKIILHCSDSQDSLNIGFKEINSWHKQQGWLSDSGVSCGYHYVIRRDGKIERGRPDHEIGAHVKGHNSESIGVCWVGRKYASDAQLLAIRQLLRGLIDKYELKPYDIWGHTELDGKKTCPNLEMSYIRLQTLFTVQGVNSDEI